MTYDGRFPEPAYLTEDELATEKVECFRCGEVVAEIETENSVCNWCLEADHHRQERYR